MIQKYISLPFSFGGFIDLPPLADEEMEIICFSKNPAVPEKNWVPAYEFEIVVSGERVGEISLLVGCTESVYYSGNVDYGIDEAHRGKNYAARALRLLAKVAQMHEMTKLLIATEASNSASNRVCEKIGAKLIATEPTPEWHDTYAEGWRQTNIYEWDLTYDVVL